MRLPFAFALALLTLPALAQDPAASAAAPTPPAGTTELKVELPKPLFVGTPKNIVSDNLEAPAGSARKPVMVPEGVVLLSRDKPVASSDEEPIVGDASLVTDGDKEGTDGSYVEFGPGKQWVQIDLEAPAEIHAIVVWHFHSQARVYKDVVVQIADDADFLENVRTLFNNDHDNSSGLGVGSDKEWIETYEGKVIAPAEPQTARFVRLSSNGSTASPMNHYIEVDVYGIAGKS